ncbi:MAG: MoaD/ThiS family protein [Spirochaetia bacterium]|nr:MoaD/ThiS family protein [Spirochaetia bacterium]
MKIHIPSPLLSYTGGKREVEIQGAPPLTMKELLEALNKNYPGIGFRMIDEQERIRPHIKLFWKENLVRGLDTPLAGEGPVHIVCALSGG